MAEPDHCAPRPARPPFSDTLRRLAIAPWQGDPAFWNILIAVALGAIVFSNLLTWVDVTEPGGGSRGVRPISTFYGQFASFWCLVALVLEVWFHRLGRFWIAARVFSVWVMALSLDYPAALNSTDSQTQDFVRGYLGVDSSAALHATGAPALSATGAIVLLVALLGRRHLLGLPHVLRRRRRH
jgi:hypothetical protein